MTVPDNVFSLTYLEVDKCKQKEKVKGVVKKAIQKASKAAAGKEKVKITADKVVFKKNKTKIARGDITTVKQSKPKKVIVITTKISKKTPGKVVTMRFADEKDFEGFLRRVGTTKPTQDEEAKKAEEKKEEEEEKEEEYEEERRTSVYGSPSRRSSASSSSSSPLHFSKRSSSSSERSPSRQPTAQSGNLSDSSLSEDTARPPTRHSEHSKVVTPRRHSAAPAVKPPRKCRVSYVSTDVLEARGRPLTQGLRRGRSQTRRPKYRIVIHPFTRATGQPRNRSLFVYSRGGRKESEGKDDVSDSVEPPRKIIYAKKVGGGKPKNDGVFFYSSGAKSPTRENDQTVESVESGMKRLSVSTSERSSPVSDSSSTTDPPKDSGIRILDSDARIRTPELKGLCNRQPKPAGSDSESTTYEWYKQNGGKDKIMKARIIEYTECPKCRRKSLTQS